MNPEQLIRLIHRGRCQSTHQRLVLDSLQHLRDPHAAAWRRLLVLHHRPLLAGAVAPDIHFRDYQNHVLYVRDDYWGNVVATAEDWLEKCREALDNRDWPQLAFALGVLSHYYTDPIQPLHTAQSVAANDLHAAFEWCVFRAYRPLLHRIERDASWPDVSVPESTNWLASMILAGAERARRHYETLVERFNFDLAIHDPRSGFDSTCQELLARLVAHAIVGYARILDRLFSEVEFSPPECSLTAVSVPEILFLLPRVAARRIAERRRHASIEKQYFELCSRGQVERCLSDEVRTVRDTYHRSLVCETSPAVVWPGRQWSGDSVTLGKE